MTNTNIGAILQTLLNAEIAESDTLPMKAIALRAQAIIELSLMCGPVLNEEQKAELLLQAKYIIASDLYSIKLSSVP
jgi:hypothetical protein